MNIKTRTALAELNRAFYARFAGDFARTRQSWPPGFEHIVPYFASAINVLDLGCGNARLLMFLHERGWRGAYTGLDSSAGLLAIADQNAATLPGIEAAFALADLLNPGWPARLNAPAPQAIAALAVLHHIPGSDARAQFMAQAAQLLPPGGRLVVSTWQFLVTPRLRSHILPWQAAGLSDSDVEPGDYLLSWGQAAAGQRYCAYIDREALLALAAGAGLAVLDTFQADGLEGQLNLYGVFERSVA